MLGKIVDDIDLLQEGEDDISDLEFDSVISRYQSDLKGLLESYPC